MKVMGSKIRFYRPDSAYTKAHLQCYPLYMSEDRVWTSQILHKDSAIIAGMQLRELYPEDSGICIYVHTYNEWGEIFVSADTDADEAAFMMQISEYER